MSYRQTKGSNVVRRYDKAGVTHVYHNAGHGTSNRNHRIVNHRNGSVRDHYGNLVHKGR